MLADSDYLNSLALLVFDSRCYLSIFEQLIAAQRKEKQFSLCGDANGYSSFVSLSFTLDASVVVYEGLSLYENQGQRIDYLLNSCGEDYYAKLKTVRNNMHLYNKYGSYENKANRIIDDQIREFDMETRDEYYELRNDIALIYEITASEKKLLGTNYYIHHTMEVGSISWTPTEIFEFARDTAKILKAISEIDIYTFCRPSADVIICNPSQIELFDYKSEELFKSSELTKTTTFRMILLLSSISYTNQLLNSHINFCAMNESGEWICFVTKWLAIKYDEIFDSINNLLQHISTRDKSVLASYFDKYYIDTKFSSLRFKAQNLRNMLHYRDNDCRVTISETGKIEANIYLLHGRRAALSTWDEFLSIQREMRNHMSKMEDCLRDILSPK